MSAVQTSAQSAVKTFSDAAAAAIVELVERLEPAEQEHIVDAMRTGCRLSLTFIACAPGGEPEIRLELLDAGGTAHRLVTWSGRMPRSQ